MTRDELIDRIRDERGLTRRSAVAIADVVIDAVLAEVYPVVQNEWCGNEVLRRVRDLRSNGLQASKVGAGAANGYQLAPDPWSRGTNKPRANSASCP